MKMFVIYEYPSDYPTKFVVLEWRILEKGIIQASVEPHCVASCIEEARKSLANHHLVHLESDDGDDCVIREIWL